MDTPIPQSRLRRERLKRWSLYGAIALAVIGASVAVSTSGIPTVDAERLQWGDVSTGDVITSIAASGTVMPAYEVIVTSPITSRIVELYCQPGDTVTAGQPIMLLDLSATQAEVERLDDAQRMSQLARSQRSLDNATSLQDLEMRIRVKEMEAERLKKEAANERYLDSLGSGTGDRVAEAEMAWKKACLECDQLRSQLANERQTSQMRDRTAQLELSIAQRQLSQQARLLEDARILAPATGVLTRLDAAPGLPVSQGTQVAVVADLDHFRVDGTISENASQDLRPGGRATVKVGKQLCTGVITNVTPQSSGGLVAFTINLTGRGHLARAGAKASIYVHQEELPAVTVIPRFEDYSQAGQYDMWVLTPDGHMLEKRMVTLGGADQDNIEVRNGLRPGERVVLSSLKKYNSKDKLKIK
ncbi:MAG: efflux RND transporter periplasmic adaptor subunit [Bacteroidales bacterium]|nr:efflux RND transporter periplasmic adaptor subunit [Bacteroidales bacterium]